MSERYRSEIEELQKIASVLANSAVAKDGILREFHLSKLFEQQQRLICGVEFLQTRLQHLAEQIDKQDRHYQEELERIQSDVVAQHQLDFDAPANNTALPWLT